MLLLQANFGTEYPLNNVPVAGKCPSPLETCG